MSYPIHVHVFLNPYYNFAFIDQTAKGICAGSGPDIGGHLARSRKTDPGRGLFFQRPVTGADLYCGCGTTLGQRWAKAAT